MISVYELYYFLVIRKRLPNPRKLYSMCVWCVLCCLKTEKLEWYMTVHLVFLFFLLSQPNFSRLSFAVLALWSIVKPAPSHPILGVGYLNLCMEFCISLKILSYWFWLRSSILRYFRILILSLTVLAVFPNFVIWRFDKTDLYEFIKINDKSYKLEPNPLACLIETWLQIDIIWIWC